MSNPSAPADLRILMVRSVTVGDPAGDALENVISNELPDGAICFVASTGLYYSFRRDAVAVTVDPLIVKPIAGPGAWFALIGTGPGVGDPLGSVFFTLLAGQVLGAPALNTPVDFSAAAHTPGADPNQFSESVAGTLLYTGMVPRRFGIKGTASLASAAAPETLGLAVQVAPSGGPFAAVGGETLGQPTGPGTLLPMAVLVGVQLDPGDTVRLVATPRVTGGANITLFSTQLLID